MTFLGPRPFPGAKIRHLDGDLANCNLPNLAWSLSKLDGADMIVRDASGGGRRYEMTRLDTFDVWGIRFLAIEGRKQHDIAAMFHVTVDTVSRLTRHGLPAGAPALKEPVLTDDRRQTTVNR